MAVVTTTRAVVRRVAIPRVARPRAVPPRTILPHIVTPPPTSPIGRPPHGQAHVSNASVYQDGIFALKLGLSACVGAAITLAVLNNLDNRHGIVSFRPDWARTPPRWRRRRTVRIGWCRRIFRARSGL